MNAHQRRALRAVQLGRVQRVYTARCSRFEAPQGVGTASLAVLETARLIADAPHKGNPAFEIRVDVILTAAGRAALEAFEKD